MRNFLQIIGYFAGFITSIYIFIQFVSINNPLGNHPTYSFIANWASNGFLWKLVFFGITSYFIGLLIANAHNISNIVDDNKNNLIDENSIGYSSAIAFSICFTTAALAENYINDSDSILFLLGAIAALVYFLMFIIIPGIIVSLTFSSIYPVAAAILYHTSNHPAEERITTALQKKSSTTNIEAELASILMDYHSEDAREVQRLINELSPFRRWQWTVKAKKHAKEADRLGRLARTRTDKLRADTELAHDVHNAERARRNHYG